MSSKTWCISDGISVVALALMCGVLTAALADAAPCNQGCTPNNNLCTGPTTSDCPTCAIAGNCGVSPGETSFTGTPTHLSIDGTDDITLQPVPCKMNRSCGNDAPQANNKCTTHWLFGFVACNAAGVFDTCQKCKWGAPMVSTMYNDCRYSQTPCNPPAF